MDSKSINIKEQKENKYSENEKKIVNEYMNKTNNIFIKNPNFKYHSEIIKTNYPSGNNDMFEIYTSYKDNKIYIASPNYFNANLDIFTLLDNKKIISLNAQSSIQSVRYFYNKKNHKEYLVSQVDYDCVNIWDISDNYNFKYQFENTDQCLLIFLENNNDYIITSINMCSKYCDTSTKLYSFNDSTLIQYINNTNDEQILYLLYWYNKNDNKNYIVQLAYGKILIHNFLENKLYAKLVNYKYSFHQSGFIYNKDNIDYLCASFNDVYDNGIIEIWDLYNKNIVKIFNSIGKNITCILRWNDKYILFCDWKNKCVKVFDIENKKVISSIKVEKECIRCIKKLYHPIYGESLLSADENNKIKLWII